MYRLATFPDLPHHASEFAQGADSALPSGLPGSSLLLSIKLELMEAVALVAGLRRRLPAIATPMSLNFCIY